MKMNITSNIKKQVNKFEDTYYTAQSNIYASHTTKLTQISNSQSLLEQQGIIRRF